MAESKVEIWNLAVSHLGQGTEIASVDERSEAAKACRRFDDVARKKLLRAYPWPFATKFATLTQVEEDPTSEWAYSYVYPTDCLEFRKILSGDRNEAADARVPYRIADIDDAKVILTDTADAVGEYTKDQEDTSFYPADFDLAYSYALAFYISSRIGGAEAKSLKKECLELFNFHTEEAWANSKNEEQKDPAPDPELIEVRG